jgi:hypothetical protein
MSASIGVTVPPPAYHGTKWNFGKKNRAEEQEEEQEDSHAGTTAYVAPLAFFG